MRSCFVALSTAKVSALPAQTESSQRSKPGLVWGVCAAWVVCLKKAIYLTAGRLCVCGGGGCLLWLVCFSPARMTCT